MRGTRPTILFFSPAGRKVPDFLARWVEGRALSVLPVPDPAEVEQRVLRSLPSRHRSVDLPDGLEHDCAAGRDRLAIGPLFGCVALAAAARNKDHRGWANARHERRIMSGAACKIDA